MKFTKKFQQGGEMGGQPSPEQMAPAQSGAPEQGGNPEEQIMAIAQDIIQNLGPEGAAMLAQVIMEMLQGAPQPQQPTLQRKGGVLVRKN